MRYTVLDSFKAQTIRGEMQLQAGQIITLPEDKAAMLIKIGKIQPELTETGDSKIREIPAARDKGRPVREIMDREYDRLVKLIREWDLEEEDMGANLWGAIQDVLERMDAAYLRDDFPTFQDAFDEVNILYAEALFRVGKRVALRVYSEVIGSYLWIVRDDKDMRSLVAQGVSEAIYTADEVRKLKRLSVEGLKAIHNAKTIFEDSRVIEVREKAGQGGQQYSRGED